MKQKHRLNRDVNHVPLKVFLKDCECFIEKKLSMVPSIFWEIMSLLYYNGVANS